MSEAAKKFHHNFRVIVLVFYFYCEGTIRSDNNNKVRETNTESLDASKRRKIGDRQAK